MQYLLQIVFALIMALVFTAIFALGLRRRGPWSSLLVFFLIIFLAAWAGSLWFSPMGPVFLGVYWVPIVLFAFIFAAMMAASTRPRRPPHVETISEAREKDKTAQRAFDAFFWVLLIGFAVVIVLGYLLDAATPA